MADKKIGVALILSAHNRASTVINAFTNSTISKLNALQKKAGEMADKSYNAGKQMVASGVAMAAPVIGAVKAFADQEEAMLSLQSVMMNSSGRIGREWDKIDKLAIQLGDKLPGTTADFYQLFETMIRQGANANDIINGTGKAASYVAIAMKMGYEEAGQMVQRLQFQAGVANKDMLAFMDDIQRINKLGVSSEEMQNFFGSGSGMFKQMGVKGLEAVREMEPVMAMLIKSMKSGEKAGTALAAVFSGISDQKAMAKFNALQKGMGLDMKFTDNTGNFLGMKNMVEQLDKMRNLNTNQRNTLISAISGEKGADFQAIATLVNEGVVGYKKLIAQKERQADIDMVVEHQLKGLKKIWDAVTGTMLNVAASIGKTLAPEFKSLMNRINAFMPKVAEFIKNHKTLVIWVLKAALALGGLALAGGGLKIVFAGLLRGFNILIAPIKGAIFVVKHFTGLQRLLGLRMFQLVRTFKMVGNAFMAVGRFMMANPIVLIIAAIAVAALLIYKYWEPIKKFFKGVWDGAVDIFKKAMNFIKNLFLNYTPAGLIFKHWNKITAFFSNLWANVKKIFFKVVGWIMGLGPRFVQAGKNIVKSIWQGIKNMVHMPIEAIKNMAKKIRSYLPFSPAKEGPLRDIHRIKLVETIAMSLKPAALINAWDKTISSFNSAINGSRAGFTGGGGGIGSVAPVYNFNVTVNLQGGATPGDAKLLTEKLRKEFDNWYRDTVYNKERISYR